MKRRSLAEMKAAYNTTTNNNNGGPRDSNYYPFWDMQFNEKAVVRFVPDLNEENPRGFLVEKIFHNLTINGQRTSVPCLSMYDEECPICKLSQEYYKANDEENGKKYYKKRQYIAQALIVEDPLPADKTTGETHEGKLKYLAINFQLYNIIKEAFAGDDLENYPDDFEGGYDFTIKKSEQGKYASYNIGTKFASRSRSLTEDELVTIETSRIDLNTLLPKNPGVEKVRALLNADVNGGSADEESFEQPAATAPRLSKPNAQATREEIETPTRTVAKPAPAQAASDDSSDMDDVLAAIRARRTAAKESA
jgi:hypothetical protein